MLKKIFLFLFAASLFLTTSCSLFIKDVKPDLSKVTYRLLLEHHAAWQESIKTLRGNVRLTLDSPQYSGNFDASILVNEPDSMLLTVTGPFGLKLGKVFVSRNRFIFYNQVMSQFYKGSKEDFAGKNFLQFPLEIGQIKDVLIARDQFDVLSKKSLSVKDNMYYLEAENGHYSYNIWFSPENHLITKIEYIRDNTIHFYKEYKNFRKVNGIYFPHHVNFVRPNEKQGLSIIFTELVVNQYNDPLSYKIKVADNAKQIDLTL